MKNLHQYMLILVAGVLGACGSMSVNDPYAEALPADFNPQEYLTLHPELHIRQIKDYVENYNANLKTALGATAYDSTKKADDAAFLADLNVVQAIYIHPQIGAHSEQQWSNVIIALGLADTTPEYKNTKKALLQYNFVGRADDYSALLTVPVDYQAVSQQYNVFGRDHGWAYRVCRPEEGANPLRSSLPIASMQKDIVKVDGSFIADEGLYCRDAAGDDRLIQ